MSPRSTSEGRRGFSVTEALVSLTLLVVVMVVALTLLFTMRSFAERVQYVIEPRQTARRAVDYLTVFVQGATDAAVAPAPNALVMYYNSDASLPGSRVQASYNNLTAAQAASGFGDEGTDLLSLLLPVGEPTKYRIDVMPGDGSNQDFWIRYVSGCPDDGANLANFKTATGESAGQSTALLLAQDVNSRWTYLKIRSYGVSNCGDGAGRNLNFKADVGQSGYIDAPGGHLALKSDGSFLVVGLGAFAFRVRTTNGVPNLEQKNWLFDPATDNPGNAFVPIIENVEDLQIAYIYQQGPAGNPDRFAFNTAVQQFAAGTPPCPECLADIPFQAGPTVSVPAPPANFDIINALGIRLSVVARSRPVTFGIRSLAARPAGATGSNANRWFRPAVEDHAAATTYDNFEHYRATATMMLKNRIPRS